VGLERCEIVSFVFDLSLRISGEGRRRRKRGVRIALANLGVELGADRDSMG